ncbi:2549_t:CDS:2 [Funneliformis geosporum]|uniref:Nitrate/nitrite transporter n=1 Tax=Funneliformis geosporum TaxID=1117311 RepID=A0A9W4WN70_9GLOM|nr:2549_t:CDS:2 [Funneliformis geosporum]CAI2173989.1 7432_t:CDS:2 [Funneliformis geosporum]
MVKLFARPLPIDPVTQKANAINIFSIGKPYMRAFHFSWLSFLTAFTGWFAIAPIMPAIKKDLNLTVAEVGDSNLTSIASTIIFRVIIGPLCDRFGPKRIMAALLVVGAIPVGLSGLANNASEFITLRFFIGVIGATFVPCQFWTTQMFSSSVVGSANALVGGWGNMGAGVTYVIMPIVLEGILSRGVSEHNAWRIAMVVPAGLCLVVGLGCLLFSDDCPQGDWSRRGLSIEQTSKYDADEVYNANSEKNNATKVEKSDAASIDSETNVPARTAVKNPTIGTFLLALKNPNVIILMFMYACSFGIELAVDNVIGYFFYEHFALSLKNAGLIGSLFGLMNLFSRATGGFLSDYFYQKAGIRGRLLVHFIMIFLNGIFLIIFHFSLTGLNQSIVILIIFSYFTQACCGSVFGIVPFVDPTIVGAISGLVGAGGNVGGLIFTGVFKAYSHDTPAAFLVLGGVTIGVSLMTFLMKIDGRRLLEIRRK